MLFRTTYWIPILITLLISTVVHVRLLMVVVSNRNQAHYASFFFKMFISQSIIELFFIYAYVFCQMVSKDFVFGEEFVLHSGYIYPMFAYYGTYYYIVHAQVWGVTMLSINRYVTVCRPFSKLAKFYERVRTPVLWLINVIVPLLMMIRMPFQGGVYYYLSASGQVSQYTPLSIVKTNSLQGMIVSIVGSVVCAICYFLVIRRLVRTQRDLKSGVQNYRREKMLTIVGFAVFLALCISTLFYVLICINAANENSVAVNIIRTYYIYALMALTFVNPWMLIITNKNTRRRMLFQRSDASTPIVTVSTINVAK